MLFSRQLLKGSQDFFFRLNILISIYFLKYKTIEIHARAFLPLNISAVGSVSSAQVRPVMKNWIAGLPGSIENPPKYWKLFFQTLLFFFETPDIEENWMFCCFLKFISIYVTNWQTWDLEWINDGLVMLYQNAYLLSRLQIRNDEKTSLTSFNSYVWFWTVDLLRTNHKIPPWKFLEISKVYKDLFWCVICGTFKLLSQNLLVNKHKLQISKLLKINQVPSNLVQNKFQKCCQK